MTNSRHDADYWARYWNEAEKLATWDEKRRAKDRRRAWRYFWLQVVGFGLVAALMIFLSWVAGGCTPGGPASGFTDEQWLQFCPDGHCPIYKAGVAINAAGDEGMPE